MGGLFKEFPYNLITPYVIVNNNIGPETPYEIEEVDARSLIAPERIDLMAKWAYIDAKEKALTSDSAKNLYIRHIRAFSEGTFTEPGSEDKNTIEKYLSTFDTLISDIKEKGFDAEKSLIPVGDDNIILDGAHRCACAAYYGKKVKIIRFPNIKKDYGAEFFRKRNLPTADIDWMVDLYCHLSRNVFFACIWPRAELKKIEKAKEIICDKCGKIIYDRTMRMSYQGIRNFMIEIYGHQAWSGSIFDGHRGIDGKVNACYDDNPLTILIFHSKNFTDVLDAKQDIRTVFEIENHSIHISDTDAETVMMADLLLNSNARHLLNVGNTDYNLDLNNKIKETKKQVKTDTVFMAEDTLRLYGISVKNEISTSNINNKNLIYDPNKFFVFRGIKFISLGEAINILDNKGFKDRKVIYQAKKLLRIKEDEKLWERNCEKRKKRDRQKRIVIKIFEKMKIMNFSLRIYHYLRGGKNKKNG